MKNLLLFICLIYFVLPTFAMQSGSVKKYDFSDDYIPTVKQITVPENMVIHSRLNSTMVSNVNNQNDIITTQLIKDWKYLNNVIAPEGSLIYGNIKTINASNYCSINGKITIIFTRIVRPDGSNIYIKTKPITITNGNNSTAKQFVEKTILFPISFSAGELTAKYPNSKDIATSLATGILVGGSDFVSTKGTDVTIPLGTEFKIHIINSVNVLPYEY